MKLRNFVAPIVFWAGFYVVIIHGLPSAYSTINPPTLESSTTSNGQTRHCYAVVISGQPESLCFTTDQAVRPMPEKVKFSF